MRGAFVAILTEMAADDPRIVLLTGDLGFTALEPFACRFPERFFNAGVAEQNMVGVATGLAEAGFVPFVYSIATFATLRPYEFIRNGPLFHHLPVRIVGIGGGFEYGTAGPTHHALEDIAVMRAHPGMTVIAPADALQTRNAVLASRGVDGPIYYRLGKDDKAVVRGLDGRFALGRVQVIREGMDLVMIAMGSVAIEAAAAAEMLAERGVSCAVAVVAAVNPPPVDDLAQLLARFPLAMTVEAHAAVGGVGSLVSEVIAGNGITCRLVRRGVERSADGVSGSADYLHAAHGLARDALVSAALDGLAVAKRPRAAVL